MKIKGFDKNLCCQGFQFEIGGVYDTGAKDDQLELCTSSVFHYCDSFQKVHRYYAADPRFNNRFCEIEVLGAEVTDGTKSGSNKIKVLREIVGDELDKLRGLVNGNTGLFNSGDRNSGEWNSGNYNSGNRNSGDWNSGHWNSGDFNSGNRNSGNCNNGDYNSGHYNSDHYNSGHCNSGHCNSGNRNSGHCNSGNRNSGNRNSGHCNSGNRNSGDRNSGDFNSGCWNSCNYSSGVFCSTEERIRIFNKPSDMTMVEFLNSDYYIALTSESLNLTEWVEYSPEEKDTSDKKETGGYLRTIPYKEACAKWWSKMSDTNKEIIKSMPNFDADVFFEITGIKV